MSAYNYFFKEEREKILRVILPEDPEKVENDPDSEDYLSPEAIASLKKDGNKVSFEQIGKIIGGRWKSVDPDRLARVTERAAADTERYKKEMQSYNSRQEAKMRSEAVKPPAAYPRGPAMDPARAGVPPGMDPRQAGYGYEMNPYMGYGYGAMDYYGGYQMYGVYPPPPQMAGMGGSPTQGENPYAGMYPPMAMSYDQGYPGGYPMDPYGQQPGAGYPQGSWGGQ